MAQDAFDLPQKNDEFEFHSSSEPVKAALKEKIIQTFIDQGFTVDPILNPSNYNKKSIKQLQQKARIEQINLHKRFLTENFNRAVQCSIDGADLEPDKITLELQEVKHNTVKERIFRWWNFAWWSIPYQHSYGRQMRFLLWDTYHDSLFGLLSLQSPILRQAVRDEYLGIPNEERDIWVNRSLNAQRVGAVPPYNELIGGKLVALVMTSNEVRETYKKKYSAAVSLLKQRTLNSDLLFITTTSAFGQSSMYDRLRVNNEMVAYPIGYTKGHGSFHVPETLFNEILEFLKSEGVDVTRRYGSGPSRRIHLLSQCFGKLGLKDLSRHGIQREFYLFPLVANLLDVIKGTQEPIWCDRPFNQLVEYWKTRWAVPRSLRQRKWREFKAVDFGDSFRQILDDDERGIRTTLRGFT